MKWTTYRWKMHQMEIVNKKVFITSFTIVLATVIVNGAIHLFVGNDEE